MPRLLGLCLAIILAAAGVSKAQTYLLQPGDRIEVSVLEDPGLNRAVLVRPDGRISLPLAGTIVAGGQTPEAVEAAIRRALSRQFVQPPTVTVALVSVADPAAVAAAGSATVYVIGEVNQPGALNVTLPIDVLQALALAGGPGTFAARQRIQVRRRGAGGETVLLFDYDMIEDGLVPSAEIALADGDVIVVPERRLFE
jgi:polysaccharide export outer membrane protein